MIKKNFFTILVALVLCYLSLTNSEKFARVALKNISYLDKIVHFMMYFIMMSVILIENRKRLKYPRQILLAALIPLSYGILMEIFQATLTATRTGSVYDALANAAGITVSILLWLLVRPADKEIIR
jgi:VanZ family protein